MLQKFSEKPFVYCLRHSELETLDLTDSRPPRHRPPTPHATLFFCERCVICVVWWCSVPLKCIKDLCITPRSTQEIAQNLRWCVRSFRFSHGQSRCHIFSFVSFDLPSMDNIIPIFWNYHFYIPVYKNVKV